MNADHEFTMANIVLGARIDLRCDEELARIARDVETRRRSQGQLFRGDRAWTKALCSMPQTNPFNKPTEKPKSALKPSFAGLWNVAVTRMTRMRRVGWPASASKT